MTLVATDRAFHRPGPTDGLLAAMFRHAPLYSGAALVIAAMIAPTLFAAAVDARTLGGVDVWVKPFKFEVSLTVYLGTLALFAGYLPKGIGERRWYRVFCAVVVAAIAGELVWLVGAAGAGVASHFNRDNDFMSAVYGFMGVAAVTLTSATLVQGVLIWRNRDAALAPALRHAIGLGLVMTFITTVITAGTMASGTSHLVGASAGATMPFIGWAQDAGDLRVAHFFATHAMQAVPLFGLLSLRVTGPARLQPVWLFGLAYAALIGFTFIQALSGRPFLPMP